MTVMTMTITTTTTMMLMSLRQGEAYCLVFAIDTQTLRSLAPNIKVVMTTMMMMMMMMMNLL